MIVKRDGECRHVLLDAKATMMPATVNAKHHKSWGQATSINFDICPGSPEQCASCCSSPVICNQKLYQIRGAITVASVAASVAAIAATTTTSSISRRDEQMAKTDMDVASAATLADAQCMEAAEVSRAERKVLPEISDTHCRVKRSLEHCISDYMIKNWLLLKMQQR
ncbi:hypothetical protein Rs2_37251 [Raphanus sativus]|nr:hypothetical protein Rs2_37251 [Raphanus sativus]